MQIISIYSDILLIFEVFFADLSFFSNPIINLTYLCIFRGPTCTKIFGQTQNKKFKVTDQEAAILTVFIKVNDSSIFQDSFIYLACKPEASVVQDNWQRALGTRNSGERQWLSSMKFA